MPSDAFEVLVLLVIDIVQDCLGITPTLVQESVEHDATGESRVIRRLLVYPGRSLDVIDFVEEERHITLDRGDIADDPGAVYLDIMDYDPVTLSVSLPRSTTRGRVMCVEAPGER